MAVVPGIEGVLEINHSVVTACELICHTVHITCGMLKTYGIDIPAILLHYNKCVNEGNIPEDQQDANYRKARQAFLV